MNRLLSKTADPFFSAGACASGACGATQVSFTYNALGQRFTMTDASGKTSYQYDSAARLISVATPLGNLNYGYDAQSNQIGQSWNEGNGGGSSSYTYDADNRLLTVTDTVGFASATSLYITRLELMRDQCNSYGELMGCIDTFSLFLACKDMKSLLRRLVVSAFTNDLAEQLPELVQLSGSGMLVWALRVAEDCFFFVHLCVSEERESFTVEVAANVTSSFPWKTLPGILKEVESAAKENQWRFRLPKLYGRVKDEWWTFKLSSKTSHNLPSEVKLKVAEAVRLVCLHAVPYFESVARARGMRVDIAGSRKQFLQ